MIVNIQLLTAVMTFLKKHWKVIAIVILALIILTVWQNDRRSILDAYDSSIESYETRIKKLNESYKREIERKKEALKNYEVKIEALEKDYEQYRKSLELQKQKKIEHLETIRHENPSQIIKEIQDAFGFEYVE